MNTNGLLDIIHCGMLQAIITRAVNDLVHWFSELCKCGESQIISHIVELTSTTVDLVVDSTGFIRQMKVR